MGWSAVSGTARRRTTGAFSGLATATGRNGVTSRRATVNGAPRVRTGTGPAASLRTTTGTGPAADDSATAAPGVSTDRCATTGPVGCRPTAAGVTAGCSATGGLDVSTDRWATTGCPSTAGTGSASGCCVPIDLPTTGNVGSAADNVATTGAGSGCRATGGTEVPTGCSVTGRIGTAVDR
ncbi:hypothetical protein FHX81_7443 [Saccharothrix saharensis]|uniref:Uncharacterized protein n=1 Tax=Saccharothrix saharensis TaxID=571190 RepID=A0A543JQ48_9PSEU|nr:hypothetical protein [Saccharothrix saharensis]TQM84977.1 hypothetical protein FHX81_7443 [Saccharothrix saharensis]